MQYIGSAKDLYLRLNEHLNGRKSNVRLQRAIKKHGLDKFEYYVYEYFTYDNFVINDYTLMDLETSYLGKFNLEELYNFKSVANSMLGYKHTKQAKAKMKARFLNKKNHPMFGKTHSETTKQLISIKKSKTPLGLYDENNNFSPMGERNF